MIHEINQSHNGRFSEMSAHAGHKGEVTWEDTQACSHL